jgi:hypothetical protein
MAGAVVDGEPALGGPAESRLHCLAHGDLSPRIGGNTVSKHGLCSGRPTRPSEHEVAGSTEAGT